MKKYYKDMFCLFGGRSGEISFSAENDLLAVSENDDLSPMCIHKGALSRYSLTIKDTSGQKAVVCKANLAAKTELPVLLKNADAAWMLKSSYKRDLALVGASHPGSFQTAPAGDMSGPAFTETLTMGEYKGQTPAAVIGQPGAKEKLLGQKKILEDNVGKYPKNADKIAAIDQAVDLFDSGKLSEASSGQVSGAALPASFEVFKSAYKTKKETDPDDSSKRLVYSLSVTCDFTKDRYPWSICIENAYAPVREDGGKVLPIMTQASKQASLKINLNDSDFALVLHEFEEQERDFRIHSYGTLSKIKDKLVEAALEAFRKAKQTVYDEP